MKTMALLARLFGWPTIFLLCGQLLMTPAFAATVISGNVSGTWTTNQSPYILSADCTVVSNQSLTIQPGVEVIIGPDVSMHIYGGILAVGTPQQPITIRGASPTNYWSTIEIVYSGLTNRFE